MEKSWPGHRRKNFFDFSEEMKIAPDIVAGCLQKDGRIQFSHYNDLKTKYELSA